MFIETAPARSTIDGFILVHRTLLEGGRLLATALHRPSEGSDLSGVARLWGFYRSGLAEHHEGEGHVVFPLVAARDVEFGVLESSMANEHAEVDALLSRADQAIHDAMSAPTAERRRSAARAVDALVDCLARHLEHEELIVLPRVVATITLDEMNEIERDFLRRIGPHRIALTVAALDRTARLEQIPMPPLPLLARVALPIWRRRYVRLLVGAGIATGSRS